MSVYHFEHGQLVKLHDDMSQAIGEDLEGNPDSSLARAGLSLSEEIEGVYVGYSAGGQAVTGGPLAGYAYAFTIEDLSSTLPWTVLVRDDLAEYVAAMRLMEPLFARLAFLEAKEGQSR